MDEVDAGAVGQPVIDEIDVVLVGLDAFEPGRDGGRDLDVALEVRVHQGHLDQRQRLRIVVNHEQADVTQFAPSRCGGTLRRL